MTKGRPSDNTTLEMVIRLKRKRAVLSEWTFRGQEVEVVNYWPNGKIEETATVELASLRDALKARAGR